MEDFCEALQIKVTLALKQSTSAQLKSNVNS
jgi:hypothetical protein